MRKVLQLIALFLILALPACSSVNVDTVWDTQYDFTSLRTYDWAPREPEAGPRPCRTTSSTGPSRASLTPR